MTSPTPQPPRLSIVIPAYNEEFRLGPTLREYVDHFRASHSGSFEVLVVLNGCRDNTRAVADQVAAGAPEVRVLEFVKPLGKGGAVWEGFAAARGELLAFADADNMVAAPETAKLIDALSEHDIAIGDRSRGSNDSGRRSPLRRLVSALSRQWGKRFLGLPYRDTQCGAKALTSAAWRDLAPRVRERGWAFDLDLLAHAHRRGMRVAETPVRWRHVAQWSKVRPWVDAPRTLLAGFGIRRRSRRDS